MDAALERAIRASLGGWPPIASGEEANMIDVFLHARRVENALKLSMRSVVPPNFRGVALALHPRLTTQEEKDFVRDADLVVRLFICSRLALPVVRYEGEL